MIFFLCVPVLFSMQTFRSHAAELRRGEGKSESRELPVTCKIAYADYKRRRGRGLDPPVRLASCGQQRSLRSSLNYRTPLPSPAMK